MGTSHQFNYYRDIDAFVTRCVSTRKQAKLKEGSLSSDTETYFLILRKEMIFRGGFILIKKSRFNKTRIQSQGGLYHHRPCRAELDKA